MLLMYLNCILGFSFCTVLNISSVCQHSVNMRSSKQPPHVQCLTLCLVLDELPYLRCPLHTVFKLTPVAYGEYFPVSDLQKLPTKFR